ncbi:hypothetical protein [Anoxybacillus sp. J5B_2022]|uniref:hypothetical protein n=1 Tax=Anoxybacillus sp. J5B_2022 TaxID=3003246 RepID=UPI002285863B|nr:hypothetical protein [Anoxybacillus sp. J5B_2022]MCZ0756384.1 hypothetical protein [Anoxybacillus sp. J5B_2022]
MKELKVDELISIDGGISACGKVSVAAFAHTAAFTGLMTLAGVSGPVGWVLGTFVGGAWLGASAAAGCLK